MVGVSAQPGVDTDFPAFEEISLGAPLETFEPLPPIAEPSTAVRSDIDMLFGDSLPAEPAPPFVTETMAELYLQQGFTAEALAKRMSDLTSGDDL